MRISGSTGTRSRREVKDLNEYSRIWSLLGETTLSLGRKRRNEERVLRGGGAVKGRPGWGPGSLEALCQGEIRQEQEKLRDRQVSAHQGQWDGGDGLKVYISVLHGELGLDNDAAGKKEQ